MFDDRLDAGRRLGAVLAGPEWQDPVVLALPRGGVPVGFAVAAAIGAELEVFVASKIGSPGQPELAMGAVAEGGTVVVTERIVRALHVTDAEFARARRAAAEEVARRVARYRGTRQLPALAGRDVLVVDDGLATGATAEAALGAVHGRQPRRCVLAVPVAAPDSARRLRDAGHDVVSLAEPAQFVAVGEHYRRFAPTADAEVDDLLARRRRTARHGDDPGS